MIHSTIIFSLIWSMNLYYCSGHLPRGVSMQRLSFFNPLKDFTCLDGSLTLPFSYVNDDFCDCPDASDEPGTAACPKGAFYCANKGFVPSYIPSSYVNDGFCDCCDASDEYENDNCTDVCEHLGLEARRESERKTQMLNEGSRIRIQMISSAKKLLEAKQERVVALENEKAEATKLKDEAENLKKIAEGHESTALEAFKAKEEAERALRAQEEEKEELKDAKKIFDTYDSNADGILQIEEVKTRQIFDINKDGAVSDDEIKFMEEHATNGQNYDEFLQHTWPHVKQYLALDKIKFYPPEEMKPSDIEDNVHEAEAGREDLYGADADGKLEEWKTNPEDEPEEEHADEEEEEEEEEEDQPQKDYKEPSEPQYDEETARLVKEANQARANFEAAQRTVQDLDRELSHIKDFLSKDYGAEDEFAPLEGQCFTYTDREYAYKLCPFDQVTQAGKSGGSETRLGTWAGWVDQNYSVMLYDKGQSCWNGPQRSTKVMVSCGLENEVTSASEPNKCEYVLEFQTPAACKISEKSKDNHDEL